MNSCTVVHHDWFDSDKNSTNENKEQSGKNNSLNKEFTKNLKLFYDKFIVEKLFPLLNEKEKNQVKEAYNRIENTEKSVAEFMHKQENLYFQRKEKEKKSLYHKALIWCIAKEIKKSGKVKEAKQSSRKM